MLKKVLIIVSCAAALSAMAQNVNWQLKKGNNLKGWKFSNRGSVEKDGTFLFDGNPRTSAYTYVKYSEQFPWMVWRINKVAFKPGYNAVRYPHIDKSKNAVINPVGKITPGIYCVNIFQNNPAPPSPSRKFLTRMDIYGGSVNLDYIRNVAVPENYIKVDSEVFATKKKLQVGDTMTVTVALKEPAISVILNFLHSYGMRTLRVNGASYVEMKSGDDKRIWTASIKINSVSKSVSLKKGTQYTPGTFLFKAVVIGGDNALDVPIYTVNNYTLDVIKY